MADFSLVVAHGADVVVWDDPPAAASYVSPAGAFAPSRLNAPAGRPHRYLRILRATAVEVRAVVVGVEAPMDVALAGRPFHAAWVQWSDCPAPIVQPVGQSSVVQVQFSACNVGLFHLLVRRLGGGGAVTIPFCVESE